MLHVEQRAATLPRSRQARLERVALLSCQTLLENAITSLLHSALPCANSQFTVISLNKRRPAFNFMATSSKARSSAENYAAQLAKLKY
jgi:hypothetical protein